MRTLQVVGRELAWGEAWADKRVARRRVARRSLTVAAPLGQSMREGTRATCRRLRR